MTTQNPSIATVIPDFVKQWHKSNLSPVKLVSSEQTVDLSALNVVIMQTLVVDHVETTHLLVMADPTSGQHFMVSQNHILGITSPVTSAHPMDSQEDATTMFLSYRQFLIDSARSHGEHVTLGDEYNSVVCALVDQQYVAKGA